MHLEAGLSIQLSPTMQRIMYYEVDTEGCVKAAVLDLSKVFDKVAHFYIRWNGTSFLKIFCSGCWSLCQLENRVLLRCHASGDPQSLVSSLALLIT